MKQKMFFSHSAVSIGLSVWRGFGSHLVCQSSFFFFAVHHCLSCPAHPPLMCFLGSSGCYCIQSQFLVCHFQLVCAVILAIYGVDICGVRTIIFYSENNACYILGNVRFLHDINFFSVLFFSRMTPNRPSNYFAKQMNPPSSSYNSQNKKTPFFDQTRARGQ